MTEKIVKRQGRQGDTLIDSARKTTGLDAIIKQMGYTAIKPNKEGFISLVEGEATNHHHGLMKTDVLEAYEIPTNTVIKYKLVRVKDNAEYQHYHTVNKTLTKEHDSFKLKSTKKNGGWHCVRTQREGDIENSIVAVRD